MIVRYEKILDQRISSIHPDDKMLKKWVINLARFVTL